MTVLEKTYHGFSKGDFRKACHERADSIDDFGPSGHYGGFDSPVTTLVITLAMDGIDDVKVLFDIMIDEPCGRFDDFLLGEYFMTDEEIGFYLG